ncbi:MAG: cell filamentation protein Fic [Planctomycetes bacterium]|nr:cell filamentation protein Fic [Planctomycetota bacterium]
MAAYAFLGLNGKSLEAPEQEFGDLVLTVAEGKAGKSAVAEFFGKHAH